LARTNFENLKVYQLSERLADTIWDISVAWNSFARDTVGKQIVRAADSIGANIAEGSGRGSVKEMQQYTRTARGSLYETKHWLRRAFRRRLLPAKQIDCLKQLVDALAPMLNAYYRSLGTRGADTKLILCKAQKPKT
jgi:four helix bundle protein